jgi:hypothetical protein
MTVTSAQFGHEHYEELCALATTGTLTAAELESLYAHLETCVECHEAFVQYQNLANEGMPFLASRFAPTSESSEFNGTPALARLLQTVDRLEPKREAVPFDGYPWIGRPLWRGAIAASLLVGVALASYQIGERRRVAPIGTATTGRIIRSTAQPASDPHSLEVILQADRQRQGTLEAIASSRQAEVDKLRADAKMAIGCLQLPKPMLRSRSFC